MTYCLLLGAPHFPVASINIFFVFPIYRWKINIIQGNKLFISYMNPRMTLLNLQCNTPKGKKTGQLTVRDVLLDHSIGLAS